MDHSCSGTAILDSACHAEPGPRSGPATRDAERAVLQSQGEFGGRGRRMGQPQSTCRRRPSDAFALALRRLAGAPGRRTSCRCPACTSTRKRAPAASLRRSVSFPTPSTMGRKARPSSTPSGEQHPRTDAGMMMRITLLAWLVKSTLLCSQHRRVCHGLRFRFWRCTCRCVFSRSPLPLPGPGRGPRRNIRESLPWRVFSPSCRPPRCVGHHQRALPARCPGRHASEAAQDTGDGSRHQTIAWVRRGRRWPRGDAQCTYQAGLGACRRRG